MSYQATFRVRDFTMRRIHGSTLAFVAILLLPRLGAAQDAARAVAGGGISVPGWAGKIDPSEEKNGQKLEGSKLLKHGNDLHVITGPAVTYWNPANKSSGNYTVKATFTEAKYMDLNDHPHPYGIVIGGNDLGTAQQSFLYCAAYGNGTFIMRGFGPATDASGGAPVPFRVQTGRGAEPNEAIHKAAGKGQSVTQEIAISVKGDKVECAINGKVVGSYDKSAVVGAG